MKNRIYFQGILQYGEPGDVILARTPGMAADVIRWWTNSHYNHTAIYTGAGLMVDSALKHGVSERFIWGLGPFEWALMRPAIQLSREAFRPAVIKYNGRRYDLRGAFSFFLPFLRQANSRMFCSEHTSTVFADLGFPLVPRKAYSNINPETVYQSWRLNEIANFTFDNGLTVIGA
jgi:hypothetical protein